ncbi:SseB family protein [Thermobifida halotolerans]|uniref:SseB family protein n=1 Tax=Thermobifida halotolerans TaxID=483545 RepID=A0A399G466_9ACTN|nr:SseB family protein [Thermobifida halotolerans]UOE17667.1 SseB family protein [Thermobifida halotolerans]
MTTHSDPGPTDSVPFPVNPVEEALASVVETDDPATVEDGADTGAGPVAAFLDVLRDGPLWVPLPEGSGPQDDGSVSLPTLDVAGELFVPVFTSQEQLSVRSGDLPFAVVTAGELASALPAGVGMAVNPGNTMSVPIGPETVRSLRTPSASEG